MMTSSQHKRSLFALTHWVLVLALLLGQSLALGHDHDADQASEGTCALCLYAQQSDNIIPSTAAGILVKKFHVTITPSVLQEPAAVTVVPFNSRAPPFISC
jgi:hypothetical protein